MQKITPFLWFNGRAEEAANFYTSIFKNAEITNVNRYGKGAPGDMEGKIMTASFNLDGVAFIALNAGPGFNFTPAISFYINCSSQEEVDMFWEKLSEGGSKERCGWLKDKFGVSWQVIPDVLIQLLNHKDPEKAKRVMQAMIQMDKINIKKLEEA